MTPAARAQNETPDGYVTRKEYEELKTQLLALKKYALPQYSTARHV